MNELHVQLRPVSALVPHEKNARTHTDEQISQIAASITEFGWTNPILVGPDNIVTAGHARLAAAKKIGMTEVPVIVLSHLTEAQRRALVIADNALALNAGWDEETLRLELAALQDEDFHLELIGFADGELARLLTAQDAAEGLTDEDAVPELPEIPISVANDLWLLGDNEHRVLCGDARNAGDVRRLMAGDQADLVFTDLPYNCNYEGYTKERLTIQNDDMTPEQFDRFLRESFSNVRAAVKPGASLYICHGSRYQRAFEDALEFAGFEVRCQIIWAKSSFAWGFGRYKFQHEPIFYAHVAGEKDPWYGNKSQSTLWQENKPTANRLHPTMKPVELVERALLNSSKAGDVVVDLFAGSGSTLIACERRRRKTRLMEIDPKYADCIVRRYQEFTGKQTLLDGDGRKFDEIARERQQEVA